MLREELRARQHARTRRERRRAVAVLAVATTCALLAGALAVVVTKTALHAPMANAAPPPEEPGPPTQSIRVSADVEHRPAESVLTPVDPDAETWEGFITSAGPSILVYDIDDPASITVVVNKQRALTPIDWAPPDLVFPRGLPNPNRQPLRAEAAAALEAMDAEARGEGIRLRMTSGYRSHRLQQQVFASRVSQLGSAAAEARTARPGHSEHQTGLAVDLDDGNGCELRACFGDTRAGQWLQDNAHRFGFILRYDEGAHDTVGFQYEPWHFRYVGVDVATDIFTHEIPALEDYFGLPHAPDY